MARGNFRGIALSVGVNLIQFESAKAAQQRYVPGIWTHTVFSKGIV